MAVHVDASQVGLLAVDLSEAPERIQRKAPAVMKKGALETKRRMIALFTGHSYAPYVEGSLEFEAEDDSGLAYKVGELDSAGPQWGLAAILAFGTSNNAPVVDHTLALVGEAEQIEKHLGDEAESATLGGRQ